MLLLESSLYAYIVMGGFRMREGVDIGSASQLMNCHSNFNFFLRLLEAYLVSKVIYEAA